MTRPADRRAVLVVELLEGRLPPAAHALDTAARLPLGPFDSADVAGFLAGPRQYDLYRIDLGRGDTLRAAVSAQFAGSGLQPLLRVFDGAGTEVALNNQDGGDPALTVQAAAAGSYFVGVSSAGNADYDPATDRRGSPGTTVGTYTLAVAVRKGEPLAPALAASSFRLAEATAGWGETVHASFSVNNRGGAAAGAFTVQLVLSADPGFDPAASVDLLPEPLAVSGLAAGGEWSKAGYEVTLPGGLGPDAAGQPGGLFPAIGRLRSGPVYVGVRVTPTDPAEGGGHRGADWQALTIVTPQNGTVENTATGSLRRFSGTAYTFTVPRDVGSGRFTATITSTRPDAKPLLTLSGRPFDRPPLQVSAVGDDVHPTATLTQVLAPGSYTLYLSMYRNGDDPADRLPVRGEEPAIDYVLDSTFVVDAVNTRIDGTLQPGSANRYPVTITTAGRYSAVVEAGAATPRLALYGGAGGGTLVYRTQAAAGGPAVLAQYLQPGVYFLEVGDGPGGYLLTTTFTPAATDAAAGQTATTRGLPGRVAVGDFNNDGELDLAAIDGSNFAPGAGGLSVFLGRGGGTFAAPLSTEDLLTQPAALAVADFDGDGRADVVVGSRGTTAVAVYLGRGDGTFRAARVVALDPAAVVTAVAAADLNGDGVPDLVVGDAGDDTVRAFLGDGGGGFRPAGVTAVGPGGPALIRTGLKSLAVADLDGDGVPDVVATAALAAGEHLRDIVSVDNGAVVVLLGRGDGTFRPGADLADAGGPGAVAVADVNRDGLADVVVANVGAQSVGVFLGAGGGRFAPMTAVPLATRPLALATADVNCDGYPDVVAAGGFTVNYLLADGRGGLTPQRTAYLPRLSDVGLALADADRDGTPDLVATVYGTADAPGSGLAVLRGNGDGTFQTPPVPAAPVNGAPVALAVADFNGDGRPDVATTLARDPAVAVALGNGDGTYTPLAPAAVGLQPIAVASADLNRDGRADLVAVNYGEGTISVLLGNGDGTFRPQARYGPLVGPFAVALADVNGDGVTDAVVADGYFGELVFLGNGDGTLRDTRTGPLALVGLPIAIYPLVYTIGSTDLPVPVVQGDVPVSTQAGMAVGDLNGDGRPDLVTVSSWAGMVTVRFGAGDGSFGPAVVTRLRFAPSAVTVTDVDGDGTADLFLVSPASQTVGVLRGRGDGTFDRVEQTAVVTGPTAGAVADLNGDGRPDLVASNEAADTLSVVLADGRGSFQEPRVVAVGLRPRALAVRDVNGDGRPDLVVVNGAAGTLSTLLGRGDGSFVTATDVNGVGRANTPHLVNLTGAVDAAGRPVLDAVTVDGAGNLLYRPGQAGGGFGPPVVLNAGFAPVRDAVPLQTAAGWVVAAAERGPATAAGVYPVSLYSVGDKKPARVGVVPGPLPPTRLLAADLAGDGRAGDLVILNALDDSITVVVRRPDGGYLPALVLPVGDAPSDVTCADFDGDGRADIAVANQASGDVTVFFNDAAHRFARSTRVRGGLSPATLATTTSVSTVVGGAVRVGDGGPATAARLRDPAALTVDGPGNVYFADDVNAVVRRVDAATGVITTVAGRWAVGLSPDGGPATSAALQSVARLAVDAAGNVFIDEGLGGANADPRVRRVDAATGVITTVPADDALAWGRLADAAGNTFDTRGNLIVRTDAVTGRSAVVAGSAAGPTFGELGVAVAANGDVYFAAPETIYRVDGVTGVVTRFAGTGESGSGGDGGPATEARLNHVTAVALGWDGNLYFIDRGAGVIRAVNPVTGVITTVAPLPPDRGGNGVYLAADSAGSVYLADGVTVLRVQGAGTLRPSPVVSAPVLLPPAGPPAGTVSTLADLNLAFVPGHREEARGYPSPIAVDYLGNVYFADGTTVRRVDANTGRVTTYAGRPGEYGTLGDGLPAAQAQLRYVRGLALDPVGNLYIVDSLNLIRRVDANTLVITAVSDLGTRFDTFGGITGLAADGAGNVLVKGPSRVETPAGPRLVNTVLRVTAPETTFRSAARSVALTAGHFTADGRPDLLVVNRGEHAFSVLAGDGAGGFAAPSAALTTSTSSGRITNYEAGAAVAGRFTRGAAVDDVAVLMRDAGEVWVFANDGDGTFHRTQVIAVGAGATGLSAAPAAAGASPDLLVGNGSGDVLRLVGNGDGTFAPPPPVTGSRTPISVQRVGGRAVALVANQQADRVTVQARAGGGFAAVDTLAAEDAGAQLAPGDVTWYPLSRAGTYSDAVVLASGSNSVLVYRALGPAADGTPTFVRTPATYPTGTNPVHLTVADVNGDAVPDMLVANAGSNDVSVLFGSYGASGKWVGTPGPRLRAGGAGPLSADLVANRASPGGSDLAITTRDGRVTVLPGRGQGFFDDGSPRVLDLGTPLAPEAPSYIPRLPVGYVVSAGGDVIRFDAAAGTQSIVSTGQNVLLVQAVDATRVIEVRGGGGVVLATAGGGFTVLAPRGAVPDAPSGMAVLDFASAALEVLVTSAGDDAIYEFAVRTPGSDGIDPIPFVTNHDLTPLDSTTILVPTLVTTISTAGGARPAAAAAGFGLVDAAAAAGPPADFLDRLGERDDDELLAAAGEAFVSALAPILLGEPGAETEAAADGPPPATSRDDLLDGAAGALERLVEAVRAGERPAADPEAAPAGPAVLERLLDALRNLPADGPTPDPAAGESVPPKAAPTPPAGAGEPAGPDEAPDVGTDRAADADAAGPVDWRVVAVAAWLLLGAAPLLHDPDRKAAARRLGNG